MEKDKSKTRNSSCNNKRWCKSKKMLIDKIVVSAEKKNERPWQDSRTMSCANPLEQIAALSSSAVIIGKPPSKALRMQESISNNSCQ
jgi:hypothetical protein